MLSLFASVLLSI